MKTPAASPADRQAAHPRPLSLSRRLTVCAALVLVAFVSLTAIALDRAFSQSARAARQELLLAQVYRLMAAAEVNEIGQLSWPDGLPEPRLAQASSGLVAVIMNAQGDRVWQSPSTQTRDLPAIQALPAGQQAFARLETGTGPLFVQRLGIRWTVAGSSHPLTFAVAEDLSAYEVQLQSYRRSLWGWLGVMALALLAAQAAVLRWGLRPLKQVAVELQQLQTGQTTLLPGPHPREIQGLTDNLNQLLAHERRQQRRYQDALADLAHSLKTPLALMRAELREANVAPALDTRLDEQIALMDRAVSFHLQRASTVARASLASAWPLTPLVDRLLAALRKVHAAKPVTVQMHVARDLEARLDEGAFTEVLGNLLDNAFKWCVGQVCVSAGQQAPDTLWLEVHDDGTGFDEQVGERVLERGVRADEHTPGHGIGLAVVRDIVAAHQGRIELKRSPLGGACVSVTMPGAAAQASTR